MNTTTSPARVDRGLAWVAMAVAGVFVVWLFSNATIDSLDTIAIVFGGVAWVALPYLILAHASERLSTTWISRVLIGLGIVGCTAFGMWAFSFVDEDAQGGLMILFTPFYQVVGAGIVYLLVILIEVFNRRLMRGRG